MTIYYLMSRSDFCNSLDRIQDNSPTVSVPVRWEPNLHVIEDEEEPPLGYELEEGEIYESENRRNILAAINFLNNLRNN